ncbi:endonuclease [Candidatus Peregrinibacteria bacterium CG11_big_fil_rev_8_21_14_0_20_46_8]|nr:MAG: endonuclease [Candidatus Peregrinibacteria bacterium CG11_big_fil_rev_8_21_14_0_20_46_8]
MYFAYIARCGDGSLYSGYTNDIVKREREHNEGAGAKYTRGRAPVKIMYSEKFATRSAAMKREYEFKQMGRKEKLALFL